MADTHIVVAPCRIFGVDYVGGERVDASTWPVPIRDLLWGSFLIQEIPAGPPAPAAQSAPTVPTAPVQQEAPTPPPAASGAGAAKPTTSRRRR